ncbi:hypothetical protein N9C96_01465 [bacterium]|nr:hypothetical protein [bacterium]
MADYYSHKDPRQKGDQYLDHESGSHFGWIWAIILVVALVALVALGSSGGGEGTAADGATPAAADATASGTTSIDAPAASAAPVSE